MSYRQPRFDPAHVPDKGALVRPFDRWQWVGVLAFAAGLALVAVDILDLLGLAEDREHPGAMLFLAAGGIILTGYRSIGGLLADLSVEFRRMLGLGFAIPGLFLAALELLP